MRSSSLPRHLVAVALVAGGCSSPRGSGAGKQLEQRRGAGPRAGSEACLSSSEALWTGGEGCGWALGWSAPSGEGSRLSFRSLRPDTTDAPLVVPSPPWCAVPGRCALQVALVGERPLLRYQERALDPEGVATREVLWWSGARDTTTAGAFVDPWLGDTWIDGGVARGPARMWRPQDCGGVLGFKEQAHPSLAPIEGRRGTLRGGEIVLDTSATSEDAPSCVEVVFGDAVLLHGTPGS